MLAKYVFDFLHRVVGLKHHASGLWIVALDILVDFVVVLHEDSQELLQQGFERVS